MNDSSWRLLLRGALKRCPNCGGGKLFTRWTRMVRNCPRCSYLFEREEGFFLGALVVNIAVTEALIIIFIAVSFGLTLPDPPLTKLAIIGAIGAGVTPLVAYPFTKTIWTAVDIIMRNALGESYRDRGRGARQPGVSDSAPQPESRSNGHS